MLGTVKLIAEPWDIGPGGYQVGEFPPGWAEWNDKFRDTVRGFWKGDDTAGAWRRDCALRPISSIGSGRKPWSSVNFVTAHDGFTLNDLVSYNDKHNEANGENNQDGSSNNHSWNCGAEGPTDDPAINTLRAKQMRNMLATLLLSQGTPMVTAGDEFARTQKGNNNAYCQDNDISWVNWAMAGKGRSLVDFVQATDGRSASNIRFLRRNRFLTGAFNEELGIKDVTWIHPSGEEMKEENWKTDRCFGMLIDGRAQPTGLRRRGSDATLLIIFNSFHEPVPFAIPATVGSEHWSLLLDTNNASNVSIQAQSFKSGDKYQVAGRSLQLFVLLPDPKA